MITLQGNKVELWRYKITHEEMEEITTSEEEKDYIENHLTEQGIDFTTEPIDQSQNEWINGLEFDTRDEAMDWLEKGHEAWEKYLAQKELTDSMRLRADIDFIAIMSEVEL